ncbi:hypothetical protein QYE76_017659, partial [Lolium multiflorum]
MRMLARGIITMNPSSKRCQHFLLLVGIDILTYRRYYDTPLYLWVIKTIFRRRWSEALLQHLEDSESEILGKKEMSLRKFFFANLFSSMIYRWKIWVQHRHQRKIPSKLSEIEEERLLEILKKHRGAIGYTLDDLKGISPSICQHAINMEDDAKPVVERRLISKMKEVVRNEVLRLLEAGIIYPIADSRWVSHVHCVPKKGGMTVVPNDNDELIPQRVVVGYRMCIDFRKVNKRYSWMIFPSMGILLIVACETLIKFCRDVKKLTLFLIGRNATLWLMKELYWDIKFLRGIEVDRAKVEAIEKMPYPRDVKGIRSVLGHAGFYRRFIKDFSKISKPLTNLLQKDVPFVFDDDCKEAFETLKKALTTPIVEPPDWNLPFEIMCDASNTHILVAVDYVTKWVEAIPTKSADGETSLRMLLDIIFPRFGVPRYIMTDG